MIVTEEMLLEATGYKQRARLKCCLLQSGVPFREGSGGRIWTTEEAISSTLLTTSATELEEIEFDEPS